ncbi:23S rRNA (adenine(2503)-C(2))-methyltransferase RlmN [Salisaeta longa]|uniref:23S rRNA (adenine(2503)-C(2))-methyltransferase RlmN n=1 Tax=Salisaeta longa TaxID=503170 RepID=UPI0004176FF1|nr:23S rRNA (adenine(2503)-C(2))-methyltransferase RlmN [Salisaeta longa]
MEATDRVDLKTMDEGDLRAFAASLDEPSYRGQQLFEWIYGKGVTDFSAMTSLPKDWRQALEACAVVETLTVVGRQRDPDGTVKVLFELPSGRQAETVLIPAFDARGEAQRLTVCVSSQVGCAMGCTFCATGQMGFRENLTAGAIFDQVALMDRIGRALYDRPVTNVVFMGMGEPLLNYANVVKAMGLLTHESTLHLSPRRITISTVGLSRRIRDLADDGLRTRLAVSLHAPDNDTRSAIMPVNTSEKTSLPALKEALQYYHAETGRPVTYEYCLFEGVNDQMEDADRLAQVARWIPSKVNLLMYNPVEGLNFARTDEAQLNRFVQRLVQHGVTVTVRQSRGRTIDAACGQLANASAS